MPFTRIFKTSELFIVVWEVQDNCFILKSFEKQGCFMQFYSSRKMKKVQDLLLLSTSTKYLDDVKLPFAISNWVTSIHDMVIFIPSAYNIFVATC